MEFSIVKEGDNLLYIGNSFAFGGTYTVIRIESTYRNETDCPDNLRGNLSIVEFTNNGEPMFFSLSDLNKDDWDIVKK